MERDGHLVAGLGNPGRKYAHTRHNVGFMTVDCLSRKLALPREQKKFEVIYTIGEVAGKKIFLAKPMAFMNNSGETLLRLARYFKLDSRKMLIIHDDIDLTVGSIKIKRKGGHGGHKGIESIIDAFGENEFTRIRIGVGHPGYREDVVGHVLGKFSPAEQDTMERLIQQAAEAVETVLGRGEQEAMRRYHGTLPKNI